MAQVREEQRQDFEAERNQEGYLRLRAWSIQYGSRVMAGVGILNLQPYTVFFFTRVWWCAGLGMRDGLVVVVIGLYTGLQRRFAAQVLKSDRKCPLGMP